MLILLVEVVVEDTKLTGVLIEEMVLVEEVLTEKLELPTVEDDTDGGEGELLKTWATDEDMAEEE